MIQKDRLNFEMLIRIDEFGRKYREEFAPESPGRKAFGEIAEVVGVVGEMSGSSHAHTGDVKERRTVKAALRRTLMNDLRAIARTARVMGLTRPGLDSKFRLEANYAEQDLLATARAFEQHVTPLAEQFISFELPATFLVDLRSDIAAFAESLATRNSAVETASQSRKVIELALTRGLVAATQLDIIVRNRFKTDELALVAWERACRIGPKPRKAAASYARTAPEAGNAPVENAA